MKPAKFRSARWASILTGTVLGVDGLLHLTWGILGHTWPASTRRALSRAVLNVDRDWPPTVLLGLAALLLAAAVLVLARGGTLGAPGRWIPRPLRALGTWAVATGLCLRGAVGVVWILTLPSDTAFYWLNLAAYTPACAALFAACVLILRTPAASPAATSRTPGLAA